MGKIFPEILNLCESRKFCDDPASRWAILPPSDLLSFIDFFEIERIFCSLGPSLRTWKLGHRKIF